MQTVLQEREASMRKYVGSLLVIVFLVVDGLLGQKIHAKDTGKTVQYISGSDTVSGYLVAPEGKGPFPALIIIHEWWGLNDWVKQNANRFAENGYIALAVDLYRGRSAASPDEAHELMRGLPEDRAVSDL